MKYDSITNKFEEKKNTTNSIYFSSTRASDNLRELRHLQREMKFAVVCFHIRAGAAVRQQMSKPSHPNVTQDVHANCAQICQLKVKVLIVEKKARVSPLEEANIDLTVGHEPCKVGAGTVYNFCPTFPEEKRTDSRCTRSLD